MSTPTVDISQLTDNDWVQVEQAALGCVSGTLGEWPVLSAALKRANIYPGPGTPCGLLRDLCRLLVTIKEVGEAAKPPFRMQADNLRSACAVAIRANEEAGRGATAFVIGLKGVIEALNEGRKVEVVR
jgi:hypothetical protein